MLPYQREWDFVCFAWWADRSVVWVWQLFASVLKVRSLLVIHQSRVAIANQDEQPQGTARREALPSSSLAPFRLDG